MPSPPPHPRPPRPSRSRLSLNRLRDADERQPHQRRRRTRRILASEGVFDSIVSLAGVLGRPVTNQTGQEIGRLDDVVARWSDGQTYPPVSGLVIRVGRRLAYVPASAIDRIARAEVLLRSARLDLARCRPPAGRGPPGQGRLGPPAGRRGRRAGHPRRRSLPGRGAGPHPAGRRRRVDGHAAAPARAAPLAPVADARAGHRLGRHSAVRRGDGFDRRIGPGPPQDHPRGAAPAPPRRAGRPARGPPPRRAPGAVGRAEPRRGRRCPRGDAARRPRAAAARVRSRPGGRSSLGHGARRSGRRAARSTRTGPRRDPPTDAGQVRRCPARAVGLPRGRGRRHHDHHPGHRHHRRHRDAGRRPAGRVP